MQQRLRQRELHLIANGEASCLAGRARVCARVPKRNDYLYFVFVCTAQPYFTWDTSTIELRAIRFPCALAAATCVLGPNLQRVQTADMQSNWGKWWWRWSCSLLPYTMAVHDIAEHEHYKAHSFQWQCHLQRSKSRSLQHTRSLTRKPNTKHINTKWITLILIIHLSIRCQLDAFEMSTAQSNNFARCCSHFNDPSACRCVRMMFGQRLQFVVVPTFPWCGFLDFTLLPFYLLARIIAPKPLHIAVFQCPFADIAECSRPVRHIQPST